MQNQPIDPYQASAIRILMRYVMKMIRRRHERRSDSARRGWETRRRRRQGEACGSVPPPSHEVSAS